MYEYLQVIKQENLVSQRRKQLENELLQRLNEKSTSNDNDDDNGYGRLRKNTSYSNRNIDSILILLVVRRKVVGLGDNPFK